MEEKNRVLRANESILDEHYKTLPLWNEDPGRALFALLAAHDSLYLPLALGANPTADRKKLAEEALGQSLRWILHNPSRNISVKTRVGQDAISVAGKFRKHAADYVLIADMHKMHERGLISFSVHEDGRLVRFSAEPKNDLRTEFDGLIEGWQTRTANAPASDLHSRQMRFEDAFRRIGCLPKNGHICMGDFSPEALIAVWSRLEIACRPETMPLDSDADLGGFRVRELRNVCRALQCWSYVCLVAYVKAFRSRIRQDLCMPTQYVSREVLVARISKASGMSGEIVAKVIERLTHYPGSSLDPLLQPLIYTRGGLVWSAWWMVESSHERNALRVMAQTPTLKPLADNLIGGRENRLTEAVLSEFIAYGYRGKRHTVIAAGGSSGEIDLLLYNESVPKEVLLVEVKAGLAPDEINEVHNATVMLEHAQGQLVKCLGILDCAHREALESWFPFVDWDKVTNKFALVVSADSDPNTRIDSSQIPAISFAVFKSQLETDDYQSPAAVVHACKERRWLAGLKLSMHGYERLDIGDVSYEIPSMSVSRDVAESLGMLIRRS